MYTKQAERLAKVLKEIKTQKGAKDEMRDFEGLKTVDLFNATISGAIAKLNVINTLFETAGNLPDDTPEDFVKYEAARLEAITREQINGLCDCLLALVACESDAETRDHEQQDEEEQG